MSYYRMAGAAIGCIGFGVLVLFAGAPTAIGVLLAMWGNNVERSGR